MRLGEMKTHIEKTASNSLHYFYNCPYFEPRKRKTEPNVRCSANAKKKAYIFKRNKDMQEKFGEGELK